MSAIPEVTPQVVKDYFHAMASHERSDYMLATALLDPVLFPGQDEASITSAVCHQAEVLLSDRSSMADVEEYSLQGLRVVAVGRALGRAVASVQIAPEDLPDIASRAVDSVLLIRGRHTLPSTDAHRLRREATITDPIFGERVTTTQRTINAYRRQLRIRALGSFLTHH